MVILFLSMISMTQTGNVPTWWNVSWSYRVKLEINATNYDRNDWPIEHDINFTTLLIQMNDFERFEQVIKSGPSCVSIITYEEKYALELARQAAMKLKRDFWVWSVAEGAKDGLLEGTPVVAGTDKPDAGLSNLAGAKEGSICATLDLASYLIAL